MNRLKTTSKYVLAILMIFAGTMHFANPAFFLKIMPPYLPLHKELVLLSGAFEIVLGVLLLILVASIVNLETTVGALMVSAAPILASLIVVAALIVRELSRGYVAAKSNS